MERAAPRSACEPASVRRSHVNRRPPACRPEGSPIFLFGCRQTRKMKFKIQVLGWRIYRGPVPYVPIKHAFSDMRGSLKTILNMYSNDCGRFPTTEEGWNALIKPKDGGPPGWHGPYFDPPELPKDPWHHPYGYRFPSAHNNTNGFDLYSCGWDGISKTGGSDLDDINNWDPAPPRGGFVPPFGYGENSFFEAMKILLIIPLLFGIRLAVGMDSQQVRVLMAANRAVDAIWFLMSVAVIIVFLSAIPPLAGR